MTCNTRPARTFTRLGLARTGSIKMNVRDLIAIAVVISIAAPAFAQTQPTRPSAYPTLPTFPSAFATAPLSPCYPLRRSDIWITPRRWGFFDPASPCYSGTIYPSFSAIAPSGLPKRPSPRAETPGSESLDKDQAKSLIEGKGYLDVSNLEKDRRGIWRGKATMEDGRSVDVTLDLEGSIYSVPSRLHIRIEPPPPNR
jgi:Peptidase propeptide and YPEB domain